MPANPVNDVRAAGALRSKASGAAGPADEFQSRTLINPAGKLSVIGNQGSDRFRVYGDGRAWVPVQAAAPASLVAGQFFIQTVAGVDRWAYVDSTLTIQYLSDPGGADTQVQFNDGGAFGGSANFTFDKTTSLATLTRSGSSAQLALTRTTTGTGTVIFGASGDRNTSSTFDAVRIFNGALTNAIQFQLYDTGIVTITGSGLASQFTLGLPIAVAAATAAAPGLAIAPSDLDTGIYSVGANDLGISTGGTLRVDISTTAVTSTLPFLAPVGAAATPSYTFAGDTDTGMYHISANRLGFAIAGGLVIDVTSSEIQLGLQLLAFAGTVSLPGLSFVNDSNSGFYSIADNTLGVATNGVLRLSISTTAITSTLPYISPAGAVGAPGFTFVGDLDTGIYSIAANTLGFSTNGVLALSISSTLATSVLPLVVGTDPGGTDTLRVGGPLTINSAVMIQTKTTFTNGAGASLGTLTNAPAVGNPTKWIPINDNGTTRYIPAW